MGTIFLKNKFLKMKKVLIDSPGSYDKLAIVDGPKPKLNDDEILIKIVAFGVNYADCCVRMGLYSSQKKYVGWPCTPGFEYSGIIESIGSKAMETLKYSYDHLAPAGKLIIYGFHTMLPKTGGYPNILKLAWHWLWTPSFDPLKLTTENKSVCGFNLSYLFDKVELFATFIEILLDHIENDKIQPSPVKTYKFDDVAQSHKDIESGLTVGKLVILT